MPLRCKSNPVAYITSWVLSKVTLIGLGIIQAARAEEVVILRCAGQAEDSCVPTSAIRLDMLQNNPITRLRVGKNGGVVVNESGGQDRAYERLVEVHVMFDPGAIIGRK